jgi:flagellar hook protein FlgE
MGFQQGLSGLHTSSMALDVVSNNIANASTVGFKKGSAIFADVYASTLTGTTSGLQVGIGSKITAVYQLFTEGPLTTTNNPLDMAINGDGFYVIQRHDGSTAYSRNGQFDIDKEGYIVTPLLERLMGYRADDGGNVPTTGGTVEPLLVPRGDIDPNPTSRYSITAGNLSADEDVPLVGVFDRTDADSFNFSEPVTVYDSLGGQHSLVTYFVKTAPGEWDVYAVLDNDPASQQLLGGAPSLAYDAYGKLNPPGSGTFTLTPITLTNGAAPLNIDIDLNSLTQFGSPNTVSDHFQDGYTSGRIAGVSVSADGVVQGRYTNGQTKNLGQVAIATFRSNQGLASLGDNLWVETYDSGPVVIGRPGVGIAGWIQAGQVEDSNVDLTDELVQMIIQQRNYQANAQTIRTQDQILQTLVNLR